MSRFILTTVLATFALSPALAQPDTDPPVVVGFDFTPKRLAVAERPASYSLLITARDEASGVDTISCYFDSPSREQVTSCHMTAPSSGNENFGRWICDQILPQYSERGLWRARCLLRDKAENTVWYQASDLDKGGFPSAMEVMSPDDTWPPTLVDFDFTPKSIDVTPGGAHVGCTVGATDVPAGVSRVSCTFEHRDSEPITCSATRPSFGHTRSGTWNCVAYFPQFCAEGTWTIRSVILEDQLGNSKTYSTDDLERMQQPTTLTLERGLEKTSAR